MNSDFEYKLLYPFKINSPSGEKTIKKIIFSSPRRACGSSIYKLKQIVSAAQVEFSLRYLSLLSDSKSEEKNNKPKADLKNKSKEDIHSEAVQQSKMFIYDKNTNIEELISIFYDVIINGSCAKLDNGELLCELSKDMIEHDDESNMIAEYIANFIMPFLSLTKN